MTQPSFAVLTSESSFGMHLTFTGNGKQFFPDYPIRDEDHAISYFHPCDPDSPLKVRSDFVGHLLVPRVRSAGVEGGLLLVLALIAHIHPTFVIFSDGNRWRGLRLNNANSPFYL